MTHADTHSSLRGSALESRRITTVTFPDAETANAQYNLLSAHISKSGIPGNIELHEIDEGQYTITYWRTDGMELPPPNPTMRMVGP